MSHAAYLYSFLGGWVAIGVLSLSEYVGTECEQDAEGCKGAKHWSAPVMVISYVSTVITGNRRVFCAASSDDFEKCIDREKRGADPDREKHHMAALGRH